MIILDWVILLVVVVLDLIILIVVINNHDIDMILSDSDSQD